MRWLIPYLWIPKILRTFPYKGSCCLSNPKFGLRLFFNKPPHWLHGWSRGLTFGALYGTFCGICISVYKYKELSWECFDCSLPHCILMESKEDIRIVHSCIEWVDPYLKGCAMHTTTYWEGKWRIVDHWVFQRSWSPDWLWLATWCLGPYKAARGI